MSDVLWSVAAERTLIALPSAEAERIIATVETFASTGRGFVRTMRTGERRLHLPGYAVTFDTQEARILILRVDIVPRVR